MPILLSTLLLGCAAASCVQRGALDAAAAVTVAWLVLLVTQLGHGSRSLATGVSTEQVLADEPQQVAAPRSLPNISGVWVKDGARSDSMEPAMALIRLNGILRTAVKLVRGLELQLDERNFRFAVFSVISWFKVVEHYETSGALCSNRRRDLRRGKHQGSLSITPQGSLLLRYEWGAPYAGSGCDEFVLAADGQLYITTVMHVDGKSVRYTQVYVRRGDSAGGGGGGGGAESAVVEGPAEGGQLEQQ